MKNFFFFLILTGGFFLVLPDLSARCHSDSECGGGVCRSGQCTTAGGKCYSNSECGSGVCRSGKCTVRK
jgi:hypothetical protein